jgi:3-oxoadipate enol-lactonase
MLKIRLNGIEFAYDRRGSGTTLVLLHGYPLDHTIWERILPLLESDFDLIVPDLRGFGESPVSPTPYMLSDLARDIGALLDQLGIKQAVIAGHSMGGYVALAFATIFPKIVRGLGLVATQAAADTPERKIGRYELAQRLESNDVAEVADSMPRLLTSDASLQARLKRLIQRQSAAGMAANLRAMAERQDSSSFLPGFKFPVVVIHGLADKLIPVERASNVMTAVKKGHLTIIDSAGHMPMLEAPQATAKALKILK